VILADEISNDMPAIELKIVVVFSD